MKVAGIVEFLNQAWVSTLGVRPLTASRAWFLPNKSGTLLVDTQTIVIPWVQQFEYNFGSTGTFKNVPTDALYMSGWLIGGGGGSGSGARGNNNANRTGGSSGSAGGRTPFLFSLADMATRFGCTIANLQYAETIGGAGSPGAAVLTDNSDGNNGTSGGTTYIRMRAAPGTGDSNPQFVCRAVGGAVGQGGRRAAITSTPGSVVSIGATFPGQVGQQGRSTTGASGGAVNGAPAAGGGGAGAIANSALLATGGSSGPACWDQAGDLAGTTLPGIYPTPGNALTSIPSGLPGSGGAGGGYQSGQPGGAGGAGYRGGSGGGGGASDNGFASGAGGPSGAGYILIKFSPFPM